MHICFSLEPVDMFADATGPSNTTSVAKPLTDEVMWEYRWKNEEGEEMHGPFSSTQMSEWVTNG